MPLRDLLIGHLLGGGIPPVPVKRFSGWLFGAALEFFKCLEGGEGSLEGGEGARGRGR